MLLVWFGIVVYALLTMLSTSRFRCGCDYFLGYAVTHSNLNLLEDKQFRQIFNRSCLIFSRLSKNVLVCELISMITGVLFMQASNCTC